MMEDLSTLGVDWADNDSLTQATPAEQSQAGSGTVILDSDLQEQEEYFEKNALVVDGYRCPNEFLSLLTPMEFEEMVNLFIRFDGNKSGTIDRHEIKKILHFLGLDYSMEKAEEVLKIVDADGSGEIDFDEFCAFIVMIKRGDDRLKGFSVLLDKLNSTPLGELERQARTRDVKIKFDIVEEREATLFNPTLYVVELTLSGMWHRIEAGEIISEYGVKKFQGLGNNTREAKYAAATTALVNLGDSMPGMKFKPGEFPEDWLAWVDDNLLRGVEPGKIVSILASKGFHPHKNVGLMHRILAWHSLLSFLDSHPEVDFSDAGTRLNDDFVEWIKVTAKKGIDGEVIFQLLKDRYLDLEEDDIAFAQQLRNNELGCLIGKNEERPSILDFWHACRAGYLDDVVIYCKCGVAVNEEVLDPLSCERVTALAFAAMNGHAEIIKVLLSFNADVRYIDRRGRNAVHMAAMRGHVEACKVLVDHGGRLFAGDLNNNTPLHVAALNNHVEVVCYLAAKGQELARTITSDKVRPRKDATFLQVVTEVFEGLPGKKLGPADTVRFEKVWLHDAALMLIGLMDDDVKYMLPRSCEEIMQDVLARFDPRPETGIFITDEITGEQVFIKTVGNPQDLSVLLNYTYRQAAIDSINRSRRTALHMACDANKINSHEAIILALIDTFGCNVSLADMHHRRAIDLLIQNKVIRDMPSSTEERERLLMSRREGDLNTLFEDYSRIDRQRTEEHRQSILDDCIRRGNQLEDRVWACLRQASIFRKRFENEWEMYEDPDTGNHFYCRMPQKRLMGDKHSEYCWNEPPSGKALIDYTFALDFLRHIKSTFLRKFGDWQIYRCNSTEIEYYYQATTFTLRFTPPPEMDWTLILKNATRNEERLGYAKEWEVFTDQHGNLFYRNRLTKMCEYDRPIDAVVISPAEMLCTAYQYRNASLEQKWYSCEQCNRAWKTNAAEMLMQKSGSDGGGGTSSSSSITRSLVVCEPCITRCHANHKGVRFLLQANSSRTLYCMCMEVGKLAQYQCKACTISETQMKTQLAGENQRKETARKRKRDKDYPPIFALVPRLDRRGVAKTTSGWHICRQCSTERLKLDEEADEEAEDRGGEDLVVGHAANQDSDTSSETSSESSEATAEEEEEEKGEGGDGKGSDKSVLVKKEESLNGTDGLQQLQDNVQTSMLARFRPQVEQQGAWVEVFDVEEPEQLRHGDLVLCTRYAGPPKETGRIRSVVRPGFYRIRFDDPELPEEVLERSYLELVSRPKFYFHTSKHVSAWSKLSLREPIPSQALTLGGIDWLRLYKDAITRRVFGEWDEMLHPLLDQVFYVQHESFQSEKAALRLQTVYRQKFRRARPIFTWQSCSFAFDPPPEVQKLKEILAGWAYLRRRSRSVGDFLDVDGWEWEEYTDNITAQYFYWQEEDNVYQWDKPALYVKNTKPESAFKEGQEVIFRFPTRRMDETAVVTKVRFDDQTGEDMYDLVHKYVPDIMARWVPRMLIKSVPMEGESLMLARMEVKWRQQIRRRREADNRKAQRERELKLQRELEQLEDMKSNAYKLTRQLAGVEGEAGGTGSAKVAAVSAVSATTRLMRGRLERIELEAQVVREEIDRLEGKVRRDRVYDEVAALKAESGFRMSRAEELKMLRSLELKYQMEDRVLKRNLLRQELMKKKEEAQGRVQYVENFLRDKEVIMTTPKSLRRRKIIRRAHIAMKRQADGFMICEWGCGDWFRIGHEQEDHQKHRCAKRIIGCALGCPVKHTEEFWLAPHSDGTTTFNSSTSVIMRPMSSSSVIENGPHPSDPLDSNGEVVDNSLVHRENSVLGMVTNQQYHETEECVKRLVICPLQCLEWVCFEELDKHLSERCVKRSAKPLECRLGCGTKFGGTVEMLIQAEDDRLLHETDECELRVVRCNWLYDDGKECAAQMRACDRAAHRDYHLMALGVTTYTVPGVYIYRIPKKITRLKVQLWGAGGGSGYFHGRQGGDGGGGAYVEAILVVEPFSVLEITVGEGGGEGVPGVEMEIASLEEQRRIQALKRLQETERLKRTPKSQQLQQRPNSEPGEDRKSMVVVEARCGESAGGMPGGGVGYAGGKVWASGGGGGYSALCRRTPRGSQVYIVAGGGGGGGSQSGRPGGGLEGELPGSRIDPVNGGTATASMPGRAGETGTTYNAQWPATEGGMWQGGSGCEFGAGGGGGYYGGGGGGTSPGISGGGGGGSSYVNPEIVRDYVVILGHDYQPGGLQHNPPAACGIGEWDKVGGLAGQGGLGDATLTHRGNNGAVRISKPGHY